MSTGAGCLTVKCEKNSSRAETKDDFFGRTCVVFNLRRILHAASVGQRMLN